MAYIEFVEVKADGLSERGLAVLKAAVTHARENLQIETHELALDDFCLLAKTGKLSGESMRLLLQEALKVLVCWEAFDTEDIDDENSKFGSVQILGPARADDSTVVFKVHRPIVGDNILRKLSNLKHRRRFYGHAEVIWL